MFTNTVVVLSHHKDRRSKILDNLFSKFGDKFKYGIAVPEDTDDLELEQFGDIIKYDSNLTIGAVKNLIIKKYLSDGGYLHIIEDDMIVDPEYISKVSQFMNFLHLPIFAAVTPESQNKVFGILCPRFRITDITKECPTLPFDTIEFYLSESKSYICVNLLQFSPRFYFDESMNYFYLSHNFWKRCHTDQSIPFLNFYPTFAEESSLIYRDSTIPSHITESHVKDATAEVNNARLKWETESNIDGPINQVMHAINSYKLLKGK